MVIQGVQLGIQDSAKFQKLYMGGRHHRKYDSCEMNGHKHVRFII